MNKMMFMKVSGAIFLKLGLAACIGFAIIYTCMLYHVLLTKKPLKWFSPAPPTLKAVVVLA